MKPRRAQRQRRTDSVTPRPTAMLPRIRPGSSSERPRAGRALHHLAHVYAADHKRRSPDRTAPLYIRHPVPVRPSHSCGKYSWKVSLGRRARARSTSLPLSERGWGGTAALPASSSNVLHPTLYRCWEWGVVARRRCALGALCSSPGMPRPASDVPKAQVQAPPAPPRPTCTSRRNANAGTVRAGQAGQAWHGETSRAGAARGHWTLRALPVYLAPGQTDSHSGCLRARL